MKIILLAHNARHDNGGGVFTRSLKDGLLHLGHTVALYTYLPSEDKSEKLLLRGLLGVVRNIFSLRRDIRSADIVHALDIFPYGILAWIASVGLKKPLVITAVGSGSIIPLYQWPWRSIGAFIIRHAATLVTISDFMRREILKQIPNIVITVIHPGIDRSWFGRSGQSVDSGGYRPYILTVGALRWRKGHKISIPAFARVKKDFPSLRYVIVGKRQNNIMYKRIFDLIREHDLEGSVHVLESVESAEELRSLYRGAELFLLISQNSGHDVEGFGMVFLEAASQGLPVIGSVGCGVEDAVANGKNGILVNEKSIDEAADAISRVLRDTELKKRFSEASRKFASGFLWEEKIAEYERLYQRITSRA